MGVRALQFYGLGHAILDCAGQSIRELDDSALRRLVRLLLETAQSAGELTTFAAVCDKPGFVEVLMAWLREMKSQGIRPAEVQAHAGSSQKARDQQLALLYARYQTFLQDHACTDADGVLWLAANTLEARPDLLCHDAPLLVLGFDQFSPIEMRILQQLESRLPEVVIYLHWEETHTLDSLALTRLRRTRSELERALGAQVALVTDRDDRPAVVTHIRQTLFETARPIGDDVPLHPIRLVAAPSREAEVRVALRAAKALILDGVDPDQVAILAPHPDTYESLVGSVAEDYGIAVRTEEPLPRNPAIATLINVLGLAPEFPWRQTFEALHGPYVRQAWLDPQQVDLLDRLTRQHPVVAGREQWLHALHPLPPVPAGVDDAEAGEELGAQPLVATLPPEQLAAIESGLLAFFDHVTPPAKATYRAYTLWLQEALLGFAAAPSLDAPSQADIGAGIGAATQGSGLNMLAQCAQGPHGQRDVAALGVALRGIRRLVAAAELLPPEENGLVPWETCLTDILATVAGLKGGTDDARTGVRFGPLEAGRAVAVDHLLILGLSEGEFPRPPQPDVFYTRAERDQFPLPLRRVSSADDASLWWEVLANCRRSLMLLRPRIDESGALWQPSPYWDAVLRCIPKLNDEIEEPPIAAAPSVDESASLGELLIAVAGAGAETVPVEIFSQWQAVQHAHAINLQRASWEAPGIYEGMILAPKLVAELTERFGRRRTWSVSRLNTYGKCPALFLGESVLELEPRSDPEEGIDPMRRGSLLHAILEDLFAGLQAAELSPGTETHEAVLDRLAARCAAHFAEAPHRFGFRPGALWRFECDEMAWLLEALVDWECHANNTGQYRPYRQELRFGLPGSSLPRLMLRDDAGEPICFLRGVIDRIDVDAQGQARVIDYKSGSATFNDNDILEGRALQTALYALAVEELVEDVHQVVDSFYLLIPKRKPGGRLKLPNGARSDEQVRQAVRSAAAAVTGASQGWFPSAPSKPNQGRRICTSACDFAGFCRMTRKSIAKAGRAAASHIRNREEDLDS